MRLISLALHLGFSFGIVFFFFNDTATTEIYTLSLHDALPISLSHFSRKPSFGWISPTVPASRIGRDRKSTRLNSSHLVISYAVFCLKKKKPSLSSHASVPPTGA